MTVAQLVPISEFCRTGSGTTPSRQKVEDYYGGSIPWVKSGELRESEITKTEEHVTEQALIETSLRRVPAGALLVAMYGATVGRVGVLGVEATTNQAVCHVIPNSQRANTRYMFHALRQKAQELVSKSVGGAQPNISQAVIKETKIFLPPLYEQKRIAAILDQADVLRRLRQRAIDRLNELGQAIFYEMFGDPAEPGTEYSTASLANAADLINGDRSSNYPNGNELVDHGILFLGTKNINGPEIDLSNCNFITEDKFNSLSRGKLKRHDLVITLRGTLGQCAEFDCDYDTGFINAQIMIIRASERLIPAFLRAFIAHPRTQAGLLKDRTGSAVPQLTAKQIGKLTVPMPPIEIQAEFSARLTEIRKVRKSYEAHFRKLGDNFSSLQDRAFRGEL